MAPSSTIQIRSDALRRLRLEAFLEQIELAEKAGVSVARIKQMEQGSHRTTTPTTVKALAEVLDCEPSAIAEIVAEVAS